MKLLTQFSIPNPSKADLAKKNNRTSKHSKKQLSNKSFWAWEALVTFSDYIFEWITIFLCLEILLTLGFEEIIHTQLIVVFVSGFLALMGIRILISSFDNDGDGMAYSILADLYVLQLLVLSFLSNPLLIFKLFIRYA